MSQAKRRRRPAEFLVDRVREPSTWAGVSALAIAWGASDAQAWAFADAAAALTALGAILLPEARRPRSGAVRQRTDNGRQLR